MEKQKIKTKTKENRKEVIENRNSRQLKTKEGTNQKNDKRQEISGMLLRKEG